MTHTIAQGLQKQKHKIHARMQNIQDSCKNEMGLRPKMKQGHKKANKNVKNHMRIRF